MNSYVAIFAIVIFTIGICINCYVLGYIAGKKAK